MNKKRIFVILTFFFSFFLILGNAEEYILYSNIYSLFYVTASVLVYKKLTFDPFLKAFFSFILLCILSIFWSISPDDSIATIRTLLSIFIILVLLKNNFKEPDVKKAFILGLFFGLLINYVDLIGLINIPIQKYESIRYMGTLGKSNIVAIVSVFYLIIILIYFSERTLKRIDAILIISSLLICGQLCLASGSRKGFIGFIFLSIFLLLLLYKERKHFVSKLWLVNVLIIGAVLYFSYYFFINSESFEMSYNRFLGLGIGSEDSEIDNSTLERKRLFSQAINLFLKSPIIGNGINSFRSTSWAYSHSNLGEILSGVGVIGFFFFYRLHYKFLSLSIKSSWMVKVGGLSAIILLALFEFSMVSYYDKFFYFSIYFIFNEINTNVFYESKQRKRPSYENSLRY